VLGEFGGEPVRVLVSIVKQGRWELITESFMQRRIAAANGYLKISMREPDNINFFNASED
jgi:hypothetical protein